MEEFFTMTVLMVDATLRVSAPLILAALAGLFAERSGVVDIALEGKLLGAAFAAATVAAVSHSAWLGLAAGIGFSVALSMIHAYACVTHKGDQVVSGMAINILVAGLGPTPCAGVVPARRSNSAGGREWQVSSLALARRRSP